jgi:hypothetical protein
MTQTSNRPWRDSFVLMNPRSFSDLVPSVVVRSGASDPHVVSAPF